MISPSLRLSLAAGFAVGLSLASPAARADFPGLCGPNQIVAGPISGQPAVPLCRSLVAADIPPPAIPVAPATCAVITSFGGVGDNATDNTAALNAALLANPGKTCVQFPAGKFKFLSAISFTFSADRQGISLFGAGPDLTELTWPNAVGTALTINLVGFTDTFHIHDLTFSTGTTNVDTGLAINQTATCTSCASGEVQSELRNVVFRSNEGVWEEQAPSTTHTWATGFKTTNVSFINFNAVSAYGPTPAGVYAGSSAGVGVAIAGNSVTIPPVVFNFSGCNFQWLSNGIIVGPLVQGISVSQSNFTGNFAGIGVPTSEGGLDQLAITTSQFNDQVDLNILSQVANLQVANSLFITAAGHTGTKIAISYPAPGFLTTITGNAFDGIGSGDPNTAISLNGSVSGDLSPAVIVGNSFNAWGIAISLNANTIGAKVASNIYTSNGTNVVNTGTNNIITGLVPASATVSGAVSSGGGTPVVRLTVGATAMFTTGEWVSISGIGGVVTANAVTPVTVVDSTHFDLPAVLWTGLTYTSGGLVSSMP